MARTRASIRIVPREFDSLEKAIPNDEHVCGSCDEWIERSSRAGRFIAEGDVIKELVVQHAEFAECCRPTGQQADYFVLMALAVSKAMIEAQP